MFFCGVAMLIKKKKKKKKRYTYSTCFDIANIGMTVVP